MKKCILSFFILLLSVSCFTQDASGYFCKTGKTDDGMFKIIASPSSFVTINKGSNNSEPYLPMGLIYTYIESTGTIVMEQTKLKFTLVSYGNNSIPKNGRLLLKCNDEETLTLTTDEEFTSDYDYSDGRYYVHPEYIVTNEQIKKILNNGIIKMRFETQFRNLEIFPNYDDFMAHFKQKVKGIEKRKNNNEDTFSKDF